MSNDKSTPKGRLFRTAEGLVVCPYNQVSRTVWACVIVVGNDMYPQGGYNIQILEAALTDEAAQGIILSLSQ